MEPLFDDYKHKIKKNRIELTIKKKGLMSPWNLTHLVSKISSFYYKIELINSLVAALNSSESDIPLENIFILDKDFSLSKQYTKFRSLSIENGGISTLYNIGAPVSLYPNKDLLAMRLIFKYFARINRILGDFRIRGKKIRAVRANWVKDSFFNYKIKGFEKSITKLSEEANENLTIFQNQVTLNETQKEDIEDIKIELKKAKTFTLDQFREYERIESEKIFEDISEELCGGPAVSEKKIERLGFISKDAFMAKYYDNFFTKLKRLLRPVVGIYYTDQEQKKRVDILLYDNIRLNPENPAHLDYQNISHHSPLSLTIIGLPSLAFPMYSDLLEIKQGEENPDGVRKYKDSYEKTLGNVSITRIRDHLMEIYEEVIQREAKFLADKQLKVEEAALHTVPKEEAGADKRGEKQTGRKK